MVSAPFSLAVARLHCSARLALAHLPAWVGGRAGWVACPSNANSAGLPLRGNYQKDWLVQASALWAFASCSASPFGSVCSSASPSGRHQLILYANVVLGLCPKPRWDISKMPQTPNCSPASQDPHPLPKGMSLASVAHKKVESAPGGGIPPKPKGFGETRANRAILPTSLLDAYRPPRLVGRKKFGASISPNFLLKWRCLIMQHYETLPLPPPFARPSGLHNVTLCKIPLFYSPHNGSLPIFNPPVPRQRRTGADPPVLGGRRLEFSSRKW